MNPRQQPVKLHKQDVPMQLIVSYVSAPSYKPCKYANQVLTINQISVFQIQ